MTDPLRFRPYAPGDESAILALFRISFGKEMSKEFWQWRYQGNPTGQVMIELAWDKDKIAAHYAVSPIVLSFKGRDSLSGLSMTTMTHPNYRGHRLFPVLANRLYERMRKNEFLLVWGFPNNKSHRGFVRDLAWENIYEIPTLCLDLCKVSFNPNVSGHLHELSCFDDRFDVLWEKVRSVFDILVKRNLDYLKWRFDLNPEQDYRILTYSEGDELLGYTVFKRYGKDVDIVDILSVDEDRIAEELVGAVIDISLQEGAQSINMWLPVHNLLHLSLEKMGFQNRAPVMYFGARILRPLPGTLDVTNARYWYYSMSDCDVF